MQNVLVLLKILQTVKVLYVIFVDNKGSIMQIPVLKGKQSQVTFITDIVIYDSSIPKFHHQ
jgi:hypothetical protein